MTRIDDTDLLFKALADPSRRKLLDVLHAHDGRSLGELCAHLEMTRQGVTQHLGVLEAANLVVTQWRGREKLHFLNPVPLQEIYERWGRDRAAMVSEVISYRGKSALREVGKVFGLAPEQLDRLSGTLIHWNSDEASERRLTEVGFDPEDARLRRVVELARELEGFPRHLSIHVGGFVLSAEPLVNVAPIEPARMRDRTVVPWDKDDIDALGFFKIDVLGLGMLTQGGDASLDALYREACAAAGTTPGLFVNPPGGSVTTAFVAEDPDEAWAALGPHLLHDARCYAQWLGADGSASKSVAGSVAELRAEQGAYRIFTPEEAALHVRAHGLLMLQPLCGGLDPERAWRSLELVVERVLPAAREAAPGGGKHA